MTITTTVGKLKNLCDKIVTKSTQEKEQMTVKPGDIYVATGQNTLSGAGLYNSLMNAAQIASAPTPVARTTEISLPAQTTLVRSRISKIENGYLVETWDDFGGIQKVTYAETLNQASEIITAVAVKKTLEQ